MTSTVNGGRNERAIWLPLTALCVVLGFLLAVQLRTQMAVRQAARGEDWSSAVADLVDSNARLRAEIEALEGQLAEMQEAKGSGALLQSLVGELNYLRVVNGLVEVSGPGVEVLISGPVSVLDLHDLLNELRSAGAEVLALNGLRLVTWTAIDTDGQSLLVDGRAVQPPYRLQAIGDWETLEGALLRPGGVASLIQQAHEDLSIEINRQHKITLPVYHQPLQFAYASPTK